MARVAHEGKVKVWFINGSSPPASAAEAGDAHLNYIQQSELNAATPLPQITADGVGTAPTNNRAAISMIDTGRIAEYPGTHGISVNLKFARDDVKALDVAWELFTFGLYGFWVVSRFGAPIVGSRIEVFEGHSFEPQMQPSAANAFQQYTVEVALNDWNIHSVLSAS